MSKINLTVVPFTGTDAQEKELRKVLESLKTEKGALMPALQQAQDIYGYLPIEVQKIIAEVLEVSLEEVFGVATFYSQFVLNPKGRYAIGVCLGTACYVKGSQKVIDRIKTLINVEEGGCTPDGMFSLVATRCIGCCGLAPVMTINEDVYGKLLPEQVDAIIAKYKA